MSRWFMESPDGTLRVLEEHPRGLRVRRATRIERWVHAVTSEDGTWVAAVTLVAVFWLLAAPFLAP